MLGRPLTASGARFACRIAWKFDSAEPGDLRQRGGLRSCLGRLTEFAEQLVSDRSRASASCSLAAELVAKQRGDLVRLGVAPEHGFREDELAIQVNVEDPVRPRHDLHSPDRVFPLLEDLRRQTGGVRPRPSGNAVLDPDVVALYHGSDSLR